MYRNTIGTGANMKGTIDIVAHSIQLLKDDGTLVNVSGDGSGPVADVFPDNVTMMANLNVAGTATFNNVVGVTKSMIGLAYVDDTSDINKPISSATQNALNLKAPISNPTFSGTVSGITPAMVSLGNVNNTAASDLPISTATQNALNLKSNIVNPNFTNNVSVNSTLDVSGTSVLNGNVSCLSNLNVGLAVNTPLVTATNVNATNLAGNSCIVSNAGIISLYDSTPSLVFSVDGSSGNMNNKGTLSAGGNVTCAANLNVVGTATFNNIVIPSLSNVANISPSDLPISTATQNALNLKANIVNPNFTNNVSVNSTLDVSGTSVLNGNVSCLSNLNVGLAVNTPLVTATNVNATNLAGNSCIVSNAGIISLYDNTPSLMFSVDGSGNMNNKGSLSCSSVLSVGGKTTLNDYVTCTSNLNVSGTATFNNVVIPSLSNVNNTAASDLPISTATQNALNLKSNIVNPNFTNNVSVNSTLDVSGTSVLNGNVSCLSNLNVGLAVNTPLVTATNVNATNLAGNSCIVSNAGIISLYDNTPSLMFSVDGSGNMNNHGTLSVGGNTTLNNPVTCVSTLNVSGTAVFSGNVIGITAAQIGAATQQYVDTSISVLVNAAPIYLNTLNELANAISNDSTFSTDIINMIGTKAPLLNPVFTNGISVTSLLNVSGHSWFNNSISCASDVFINGTLTAPTGIYTNYVNSSLLLATNGGSLTVYDAGNNVKTLLDSSGNITNQSNLYTQGNAIVGGTSNLKGVTTNASSLNVSSYSTFNSNATAMSNFNVNGKCLINGFTTVASTLNVSSTSIFNSTTTLVSLLNVSAYSIFNSNATAMSNFNANGNCLFNGFTTVASTLNVSSTSIFNSIATLASLLNVSAYSTFNSNATAMSNFNVNGNCILNAFTTVASTLNVSSTSIFNNTTTHVSLLNVSAYSTFNSNATAMSNFNVNGNLNASTFYGSYLNAKDVLATNGGTVSVYNGSNAMKILLDGNGNITNQSNLYTQGNATIGGNCILNGFTTVASTLNISSTSIFNSTATFASTLNVSSTSIFNNTTTYVSLLNVSAYSTFNSNATAMSNFNVNGNLNANTFYGSYLNAKDVLATNGGTVAVYNGSNAMKILLDGNGNITNQSNLYTQGNAIIQGVATVASSLNASSYSTFNSNATAMSNFNVNGNLNANTFYGSYLNAKDVLATNGGTVSVYDGSNAMKILLDGNGNITNQSNLYTQGNAIIQGTTALNGVSTATSTLNVSGVTVINSNLTVYGLTTLGNASITQYAPLSTNLNNINNIFQTSSVFYTDIPVTQPIKYSYTWYSYSGSASVNNNYSTITNQWGYVEANIMQVNFTATNGYIQYTWTQTSSGLPITVSLWIKLGTATNVNLQITDGSVFMYSTSFASPQINSSSYTKVSFTYTTTARSFGSFIIGTATQGAINQSSGTFYIYGMTFEYANTTTTLTGNLNISNNVTCSSVLSVGGNATCSSNLNVVGNLNVSNNLTCSSVLSVAGATTCLSSLNVVGNLTILGSITTPGIFTSSYCSATLYGTSITGTSANDLTWGALTLSTSDITHSANSATFTFANAGIYDVSYSLATYTGSTGVGSVSLMKNVSGTWTAQCVQSATLSSQTNLTFTFTLVSISAGDQWKLSLYDSGPGVTLINTCGVQGTGQVGSYPISFVKFHRVG
jgi:hypothetical protein